jgi:hypothetical protein
LSTQQLLKFPSVTGIQESACTGIAVSGANSINAMRILEITFFIL